MRLALLSAIIEANDVMKRPRTKGWVSNAEIRQRIAERSVVVVV